MRTWLDELTETTGRVLRARLFEEDRTAGADKLTDYHFMRALTGEAMVEAIDAARHGAQLDENTEFMSTLGAFFARPEHLRVTPYACAVGRDLVRLFAGTAASPEIVRFAQDFAKQKLITYVDVADRALLLGETDHLKAIIVVRVPQDGRYVGEHATDAFIPDESDRLRIFAVMGPVGELAGARAVWVVGSPSYRGDNAFASILRRRNQAGIEQVDILDDIENLLWLTLAYAAVAEPEARERMPMAVEDDNRRRNRAFRRRQRGLSLFRIERLRPPRDNFGRKLAAGGDRNGWQLGRRITVRGHFKMQPHGPRSELRKLIFVGPHRRGPIDAAPLHAIRRLDIDVGGDQAA